MPINVGLLKPFPPNFDFQRYARGIEASNILGRPVTDEELNNPDLVLTFVGPIKRFPADYQLPK